MLFLNKNMKCFDSGIVSIRLVRISVLCHINSPIPLIPGGMQSFLPLPYSGHRYRSFPTLFFPYSMAPVGQ